MSLTIRCPLYHARISAHCRHLCHEETDLPIEGTIVELPGEDGILSKYIIRGSGFVPEEDGLPVFETKSALSSHLLSMITCTIRDFKVIEKRANDEVLVKCPGFFPEIRTVLKDDFQSATKTTTKAPQEGTDAEMTTATAPCTPFSLAKTIILKALHGGNRTKDELEAVLLANNLDPNLFLGKENIPSDNPWVIIGSKKGSLYKLVDPQQRRSTPASIASSSSPNVSTDPSPPKHRKGGLETIEQVRKVLGLLKKAKRDKCKVIQKPASVFRTKEAKELFAELCEREAEHDTAAGIAHTCLSEALEKLMVAYKLGMEVVNEQ